MCPAADDASGGLPQVPPEPPVGRAELRAGRAAVSGEPGQAHGAREGERGAHAPAGPQEQRHGGVHPPGGADQEPAPQPPDRADGRLHRADRGHGAGGAGQGRGDAGSGLGLWQWDRGGGGCVPGHECARAELLPQHAPTRRGGDAAQHAQGRGPQGVPDRRAAVDGVAVQQPPERHFGRRDGPGQDHPVHQPHRLRHGGEAQPRALPHRRAALHHVQLGQRVQEVGPRHPAGAVQGHAGRPARHLQGGNGVRAVQRRAHHLRLHHEGQGQPAPLRVGVHHRGRGPPHEEHREQVRPDPRLLLHLQAQATAHRHTTPGTPVAASAETV